MFCDEALESIDGIATGEIASDGRVAAHLASCPNCAAALESARTLERLLRHREIAVAPPHFTQRTMSRVRRARWQREQFVDAGFNVAIVVVVLAIVAAIWAVVDRSGLSAVSSDAIGIVATGLSALAQQIAPSLPLYLGATALLATAIGVWWWAERGVIR